MGPGTLVSLKDVWAMLDHCLPGWSKRETDHHWQIRSGARVYQHLPLGPRGRRSKVDVEAGHVRGMARFFNILDCATRFLESR